MVSLKIQRAAGAYAASDAEAADLRPPLGQLVENDHFGYGERDPAKARGDEQR
jgi:hypothetical protein